MLQHNCTTTAAAAASATHDDSMSARALLLLQSQLQALQASSRQQLAAAGAGCAAKVAQQRAVLLDSLCEALQRQRRRCLLAQCWLVWLQARRHAQQLRAAALGAAVRAWRERAHVHASTARRVAGFQQRHLQRVLRAWHRHTTQQQCSKAWASRWADRRRLHQAFGRWRQLAQRTQDRLDAWQAARQRQLLRAWRRQCKQAAAPVPGAGRPRGKEARRDGRAATQRSRHLVAVALHVWRALPLENLRLRAIAAAVAGVRRQQLLAAGLTSFAACCAERSQARCTIRRCLVAWADAAAASAARHARSRRLLQVRATAQRWQLLHDCLRAWLTEAWRAGRRSDRGQARALQAAVAAQAAGLTAAEEQMEALRAHAHGLQLAARQAGHLAAPELPLAPSLEWTALEPASSALQARARHATLCLETLQPPSNVGCPTGLLGCLVVVGGVGAGESWLSDASLLAVCSDQTDDVGTGCITAEVAPLPTASGQPCLDCPVWPARDFAACACSPAAFVVVGGFHGSVPAEQAERERLELRMCVLQRQPPPAQGSGDTAAATPSGWLSSWRGTWQALQPRAHNRAPPARSLHTATFHEPSHSVLVFGGWASGHGCLSDCQVFDIHHREWWQLPRMAPQAHTVPGSALAAAVSPAWPCARRSHAAVTAGGGLFIHGGLDAAGGHLSDLWRLDLSTWQWQQLAPLQAAGSSSSMPAPRRAHAMAAVCGGRFLLLHGGYQGRAELLGDAWAWDTRHARWLPIDLALQAAPAPAAASPAPASVAARALHTLTQVGPHVVVVGGHGPAGVCGPRDSVGLLASPSVLHAQQLQRAQRQASEQLQALRRRAAVLQGEVAAARSDLQLSAVQAADEERRRAEMEQQQAGLAHEVCSLRQQLAAVEAKAAAAAAAEVAALTRRLARARAAGLQACAVAAALKQ